MTPVVSVRGSLPEIIRNEVGLHTGDLVHYFQIIFNYAQNLNHPYHNFRHMFHVMVMCYQACVYYRQQLNGRQMRNLLIAAMFHDFDHSGMMGNDDLNVTRAIRGLEKYILPMDREHITDITSIIRATEFPYKVTADGLPLLEKIIRDADMSQSMTVAWIQEVVFGLAREWGKTPFEVLKGQEAFTRNIKFHTEWGQSTFSQKDIDDKVAEIQGLIELLSVRPTTV